MQQQRLRSLSDILYAGPCQVNTTAEQAERTAEAFCKELGIYLPNLSEYNTMSAYLFPHTSYERLFAIIVLNNLLFYIDDQMDRNDAEGNIPSEIEQRRMFDQIVRIFKTGHVQDNQDRLQVSAKAIRDLFLPLSDPRWLKRLIENTEKHLKATTYDSGVQSNRTGRNLVEHYIAVRDHDSGMVPTVDLIEFASNIYLPDEVLAHSVLQEAMLECTRVAGLMNDIFSYHRECVVMGSDFNLVAVSQHAFGLSFERALDYSIGVINENLESFLAKEANLPSFDDESIDALVHDYYHGLKDQIIAAWHWQLSGTNRYRSPESPFEELRHML
ncbi:MAG: terpene synthase family protein [Chloroflexota bacterium]